MEHAEFVERYKNGEIDVHIDKEAAGFFYEEKGFMPQYLRNQQRFIRFLFLGGTIGSIALFFYIPWYFALILLILSLQCAPKAQTMAAKGVLEASLKYPDIYYYSVSKGVLSVSERGSKHVTERHYTSYFHS